MSNEKGLQFKYDVFKKATGEQLNDCFVLRPIIDPTARHALRTYALDTPNMALALDLMQWLSEMEMTIGYTTWVEFKGNVEYEVGDVFPTDRDRYFKVIEKELNVHSEGMKDYRYKCELISLGLPHRDRMKEVTEQWEVPSEDPKSSP